MFWKSQQGLNACRVKTNELPGEPEGEGEVCTETGGSRGQVTVRMEGPRNSMTSFQGLWNFPRTWNAVGVASQVSII